MTTDFDQATVEINNVVEAYRLDRYDNILAFDIFKN